MLAGQFVTCLTRKYIQLEFGHNYEIERVTRIGSLKFFGMRHLYDRKNFALVEAGMPVHVPVAKPKPAPVIKKTLAEELIEKVNHVGCAGTCSYAIEFANGHRRFQSNDACHARIRWGEKMSRGDEANNPPVAIACNIHGHIKHVGQYADGAAYKAFVNYMLNDSPWADAWLTKDVDEAMKGCAMMDVTKPYSYVCSAAIAMRTGSEYAKSLKVFKDLLDWKYNPNVAYLVSQCTTVHNNGAYQFIPNGGSHHVWHTGMEMSKVVSFFNDKKLNVEDKPYNNSPNSYYTIFKVIGSDVAVKQGSVFETVRNDNKEFLVIDQRGWAANETISAKSFTEYLKIVNTFARKFK